MPSQASVFDRLSHDYASLVFDSRTSSETSETPTAEVSLDSTSSDPRLEIIWKTLLEAKLTTDDHDPILMALKQQLVVKPSLMPLLKLDDHGTLHLEALFADEVPPYAILSHTWGPDTEEVSFNDVINGTGKSKAGYDKIRFCGEQAKSDGLQYFWVDTCCINKSSNTELTEAINSMFRWYRDAAKCYVFLSDVPRMTVDSKDQSQQLPWELAFRTSRWFTRGWTLQELIAPRFVEFFSKDWELLGDKNSLERHVCEITGIPAKALRGSPLSDFSVTERMSWAETRQTTREEDMAYSLLGIFGVYLPLIYGEGRDNARGRLREAIDKKEKGMLFARSRLLLLT
jgi:hypothetical protein